MHWLYLAAAIVFEVAGTSSMKASDGFRRWLPSLLMAVFYLTSLGLLTLSLRKIPVSTSYAIWSGLGTALIALVGWLWFEESLTPAKLASIALIIVGVVGLNLSGGVH